jgi:hypothetical protein
MNRFYQENPMYGTGYPPVMRPAQSGTNFKLKGIGITLALIVLSNVITHRIFHNGALSIGLGPEITQNESLYLIEEAGLFVANTETFELKVREVSDLLAIPPEWLMAVMYSESKFNAAARNHRGSGATGLIQWMPATAKELNTTVDHLRKLDHLAQMDYVFRYLDLVRKRYGEYESLTDLYLAILYPRARTGDYCYSLYAKPSQQYEQNKGLDEDMDGRVTISDIDKRLRRIYPTACLAKKPK